MDVCCVKPHEPGPDVSDNLSREECKVCRHIVNLCFLFFWSYPRQISEFSIGVKFEFKHPLLHVPIKSLVLCVKYLKWWKILYIL